jgi:hypothetical protein
VTQTIAEAILLDIPVSIDTYRLFKEVDPSYELWITSLIDVIREVREKQSAREEAEIARIKNKR